MMAANRLLSFFTSADVSLPVFSLTILFGIGSWLTINGVWVELPSIVPVVPEQWNLPSYLSLICQLSNIGPIFVLVLNKVRTRWLQETVVTYVIIIVGVTSCVMSAFLWQTTSTVGGVEHSVPLFLFVFLMSLCDCTSTVIFLPFMSLFKPNYMTGLYIGEGLSALVPGMLALSQGVGETECRNTSTLNTTTNSTSYHLHQVSKPPNFPVQDFFLALAAMMLICGISFTLLKYAPFCKKEHTPSSENIATKNFISNTTPFQTQQKDIPNSKTDSVHTALIEKQEQVISNTSQVFWLAVICWLSFISNGFLPSINTYSALPYGSKAFHLSAILDNIGNPIACLVAFFFPSKSFRILMATAIAGTVFSVYLVVLAATSPNPPLVDSTGGSVLMVCSQTKILHWLFILKNI